MRLLLLLLLSLPVYALPPATELNRYVMFDHSPADHGMMVAGRTFKHKSRYGKGPIINCNGTNYDTTGKCYFAIDARKWVPGDAKAVRFRVKAKAWTFGENSYCLMSAKIKAGSPHGNNHFIHVEEWGHEDGQRRRVVFATIDVVLQDNAVVFKIERQNKGHCINEIAIYIEGYWL